MSDRDSMRILFNRVWCLGAQAVIDSRNEELRHLAHARPTLDEYQTSTGLRMSQMIKVVHLGLTKLRASGEFPADD